jgi:hypothetical protein
MVELLAVRERPCPASGHGASAGCLVIEAGTGLTLWSGDTTLRDTGAQAILQIARNQQMVIGRHEPGQIAYLDPRFRPTCLAPQGKAPALTAHGDDSDRCVSRGHFMLRARREGIVLVNGVPRRGGGFRPPVNGTVMLAPDYRCMGPGEEFLIARGTMARIQLPNGTVISIQAT